MVHGDLGMLQPPSIGLETTMGYKVMQNQDMASKHWMVIVEACVNCNSQYCLFSTHDTAR
jgi:hypothetical protein